MKGTFEPRDTLLITAAHVQIQRSAADGPFWIGRHPECALIVHDAQVSRYHVRVESRRGPDGVEWGASDNSSFGTWTGVDLSPLPKAPPHWFGDTVELRLANPTLGPVVTLSRLSVTETRRPILRSDLNLTPGDTEVLAGILAGHSDRIIANLLTLTPKAVSTRIERLRDRIEQHEGSGRRMSRVELANLAARLGITPMTPLSGSQP